MYFDSPGEALGVGERSGRGKWKREFLVLSTMKLPPAFTFRTRDKTCPAGGELTPDGHDWRRCGTLSTSPARPRPGTAGGRKWVWGGRGAPVGGGVSSPQDTCTDTPETIHSLQTYLFLFTLREKSLKSFLFCLQKLAGR